MQPSTVEFLQNMLSVTLGWGLGILSGALTQWTRERKLRKAVKRAISRELRETAYRMLALIYKLEQRHGGFNRQLLEWMKPQVEKYEGPNPSSGLLAGIRGFLGNTDDQLAAFAAQIQPTIPPQQWPSEEVGYTLRKIDSLQDHEPDYAVRVLDVLSHVRMLNDARENNLYYLRLTFLPGLSEVNYTAARNNINGTEQLALQRARVIVEAGQL